MKELLECLYYRRIRHDIDMGHSIDYGIAYFAIFYLLVINVASIVILLFAIFQAKLNLVVLGSVLSPLIVLFIRFAFFVDNKKKQKRFKDLEMKYENDEHYARKGIFLLLYLIGTIALFIAAAMYYFHIL